MRRATGPTASGVSGASKRQGLAPSGDNLFFGLEVSLGAKDFGRDQIEEGLRFDCPVISCLGSKTSADSLWTPESVGNG